MRAMMIQILVGAFGTVHKGLEKRIEELKIKGRIDVIQNTALLRSVRTLGRILEA